MLYQALRATAAIALRWYYADVVVLGRERIPRTGPLIVIANHPNALIDPLLVGTALPRPILITAKATLFEGPLLAFLFRAVGVVPLRRAKDEPSRVGTSEGTARTPDRDRNAETFRLVTDALGRDAAVLVFPEGISHDEPAIAPLKSGAARMALQARTENVDGVRVLPVGLIFEEKERPGSRVLVRIGEPLDVDAWLASSERPEHGDATALTRELDTRLRAITLNFASPARAASAVRLARTLAAIGGAPRAVEDPRSLITETELANRIDAATSVLSAAPRETIEAADALTARLATIERELERRHITLEDVRISPRVRPGVRFVVREGPLALVAVLVASLGRVAHWIPLRLARVVAMRSIGDDRSRDQPAMRTILFGLLFVTLWYAAIAVVLARLIGPVPALLGLVVIFSAAHADRLLHGRLRRAVQRARSYLALRADPALQGRAIVEIDALLAEALMLEHTLSSGAGGVV